MFDIREIYKEENEKVEESYNESIKTIGNIINETEAIKNENKQNYYDFFNHTGKLILNMCEYEQRLDNTYFANNSFEKLLEENNGFYDELISDNYLTSYANPSYCVQIFGENLGQLFSYFYLLYRSYTNYIFYHKIYKMEEYNQLFIEIYDHIKRNPIEYEPLKELMTKVQMKDRSREYIYTYKEQYDPDFRFIKEIIEEADLSDLKYLFKTGHFISTNEIETSKFMINYSQEDLEILGKEIVKAYYRGFERENKDITKKSSIGLVYKIGLERLYREIFNEFEKRGLKTTVLSSYSTRVNKQYDFDHKFDFSLYLSESYTQTRLNSIKNGLEGNKQHLANYSGILYIEKFGETPFSPENKKNVLKLNQEQQRLYQKYNMEVHQLYDSYAPRAETSFCIVSFPTPEIGDNFIKIFDETVKINMLESEKYESIQQIMIDLLDQADTVYVKGKGTNKTDLIVKIQPINDPENETNFVNTGSSVNIPAGEIFTAPQLKGTNGILHVEETYQSSLRYDNLVLKFKDGYVEEYSCTNFESEEQNKRYIEENLLFPHKTLPIGEFAIGTNTLAFVMAHKYNIMNVLPILIAEKTGPHFAIGDTCFSRSEDQDRFNLINDKLICAKDNEKSRLRKENPQEAYTNKHEDITLAFDSLGFITAHLKDGTKVDLIRDGRFVLTGTEELNIPLDEMKKL